MAVQKTILVKFKALVEGLNEVKALVDGAKALTAAGAGGGTVAVKAGAAGEVRLLVAEIQKLGQEIKNLQPGKLTQLIQAGGNVGAFLSGVSRYREAVAALQKAKTDVGNAIGRVTARAQEFGSTVGQKVTGAVEGLSARLPGLSGGLGGAGAGMVAVGGAGAAAATGIGLVLAGVLAFVAALALLSAAVPAAVGQLKALFDRGVEYNSQLEQTRLGIASVVASLAEVRAASGVRLEGADALNASFELAGDQLAKLKVDAINTTATFGEIAPAFQAAIGPGVRAGLTLDQIRETTVKIVQAAGALGIPMHQVNQEVRAILEGTINEDARLAKVLGISNEMVKKWREQGKLQEELNARLNQFGVAGERAANTMDGLRSNLREAFEVFSGDATDEAFETLKQRMQRLLPQLFDFRNARLDASFQPLSDLLDGIFVRGVNIAGDFIDFVVSGVKSISRFVGENRDQFHAVLDIAEDIGRMLGGFAAALLRSGAASGTWKSALDGVHGTLRLIQGVLIALSPLIDQAATAMGLFLAAMQANPGFQALMLLGRMAGAKPAGGGAQIGFDAVQLNPDGSLKRPTLAPLPGGGGGGKKGGGGRKGGGQDRTRQLVQAEAQAELDARAAALEEHFNLFKAELDRERDLLGQRLEDRLVSIKHHYAQQRHLIAVAGDNEIAFLEEQIRLAQERRDLAIKSIDPELKGRQRELAVAAELLKYRQEYTRLESQLTAKRRERDAALQDSVRNERLATEELQRQSDEIGRQLAELQGGAAEAAKGAIKERFRELRESFVKEFGAASEAVQQLDQYIQLLIRHAQFDAVEARLRRVFAQLDIRERQVDAAQKLEGFSDEEAERRKLVAARALRGELEAQLGELEGIAKETKDPELLQTVERLKTEISLIGVQIDNVGRQINEDIKQGLKDTLAGIIRDVGSAGERLLSLVNQILDRIAALLADRIVEGIFGPGGVLDGILGGRGQQGSAGGVGGILSKILGFPSPGAGGGQGGGRVGTPPFNPNPLAAMLRGFQQSTTGGLRFVGSNTFQTVGELREGFGSVGTKLQEVVTFLPNLLPAQGSIGRDLLLKAVQFAGAIAQARIARPRQPEPDGPRSAAGGLITGPGTGTSDSILSWLSNGEYVIRAASVRSLGTRLLDYINEAGELPIRAYVEGGMVGPPVVVGGEALSVTVNQYFTANTPSEMRLAAAAVKRDASRGVQDGIDRARKRRQS